jgi:hypothetical protein
MDAAVPVDAQNAPTATWKTAQNAVSHSAHTLHRVSGEPEKTEKQDVNHAPHTKFLTLPAGVSTLLKQANPEEALPPVLVSTASGMGPSIPI